jgi:hypothetical protein
LGCSALNLLKKRFCIRSFRTPVRKLLAMVLGHGVGDATNGLLEH